MGLRLDEHNTDSNKDEEHKMSDRLSSALDFLRDELRQLRAQDVALLRQMLKIQSTIKALTRPEDRRSHSVADELEEEGKEPIDIRPRMNSLDRRPTFRGSPRAHPPLARYRSVPGGVLCEEAQNEDADCSEDFDVLALSANSSLGDDLDEVDGGQPSSSSILIQMRQKFATIEEEAPGSTHSSNLSLATPGRSTRPSSVEGSRSSSASTHTSSIEGSRNNSTDSPIDVSSHSGQTATSTEKEDIGRVATFDFASDDQDEEPTFELGYYTMPQSGKLQHDREWHSLDLNQNELSAKDNGAYVWNSVDVIQRLSLGSAGKKASRLEKYEPEYENILKRSSQLWREIQKEQSEKGSVDERKLTTFKLFI